MDCRSHSYFHHSLLGTAPPLPCIIQSPFAMSHSVDPRLTSVPYGEGVGAQLEEDSTLSFVSHNLYIPSL